MTRPWAAGAAVALCACGGTLFVEPHPPRLRRVVAQYTTLAVAEPLVYVPLLDLYVEDPGSCVFAKGWFLDAARGAVRGLASDLIELAPQDLAPLCTQREGVALDVESIVAAVRSIASSHPQAHVRPVILYANGLNLPLSPARSTGLAQLVASLTAQQGTPPLIWLVASPAVAQHLVSNHLQDWTYAGDPAVAGAMRSFAQLTLPLQTEAGTVSDPQPLLSGADLASAQEFKLCAVDAAATMSGLPEPGIAARIDRAAPPAWRVVLPAQVTAPKAAFSTHIVTAKMELCDGNCDRFYTVDPDVLQHAWDVTQGCLLSEAK